MINATKTHTNSDKYVANPILIILLLILSLSKAGFYKSDILIFSVVLSIIGFIRIAVDLFTTIKTKSYKFDIIEILLLLLSLTYILPILFKNYADLNSNYFPEKDNVYYNPENPSESMMFSNWHVLFIAGVVMLGGRELFKRKIKSYLNSSNKNGPINV